MKVKILMFIGMFVFGFAAQGEAQTITPNIKVRQIHILELQFLQA